LVETIRSAIRDLDPDQAMTDAHMAEFVRTLYEGGIVEALTPLGAMGVLGLLLALVGLYGLLAYEVNARTREIGIRIALGARAGAVVRMVLRQGVALAVVGAILAAYLPARRAARMDPNMALRAE
jgi:ABC-type antimicrobial peptide transport system permease subunit